MLEKLREAGVVGGGGAGFPTWKKLDAKAEILLLNAVECEPVLAGDKYLMRREAPRIIKGLSFAARQLGAREIVIAVKENYEAEIVALQKAVTVSGEPVRIHKMRPVYPAGDEHVAVFEATGRTVPPGGIPLMAGVVVVSVSTAANIAGAMAGIPVTRRFVTVAGKVGKSVLLDVPIGASVEACIAAAGGATLADFRVVMGGPMMGKLLPEGGHKTAVITKTGSGVLVLPPEHILARCAGLQKEQMLRRARSACIQCRYCTEMCPRYLLGHNMHPHRVMRAMALGENLSAAADASLCSECGVCEMYACPMSLSPRQINRELKPLLRQAGIEPDKTLRESHREMRFARQVPSRRLSHRTGVAGFAPDSGAEAEILSVSKVAIPLLQHIGEPCRPCVSAGDKVEAGQVIGTVRDGALGACVHASITGVVQAVDDRQIIIKSGAGA